MIYYHTPSLFKVMVDVISGVTPFLADSSSGICNVIREHWQSEFIHEFHVSAATAKRR